MADEPLPPAAIAPAPALVPAAKSHPVDEDKLFTPADEEALDRAFEAEAKGPAKGPAEVLPQTIPDAADPAQTLADLKASLAPRKNKNEANAIDPALLKQTKRAFDMRQKSLSSRLPRARIRRTSRLAAFVLLISILVLGFTMRTDLVRWYPSLAGLYSAIGLPVNIVGLEFENSKTLMSFRNGKPVMLITSRIRSISGKIVKVPPVLVSLIDATGASVYEWTVTPRAPEMGPGEIMEFSTEVSAPPQGAVTVRLSFTNPRGGTSTAVPAGTL